MWKINQWEKDVFIVHYFMINWIPEIRICVADVCVCVWMRALGQNEDKLKLKTQFPFIIY